MDNQINPQVDNQDLQAKLQEQNKKKIERLKKLAPWLIIILLLLLLGGKTIIKYVSGGGGETVTVDCTKAGQVAACPNGKDGKDGKDGIGPKDKDKSRSDDSFGRAVTIKDIVWVKEVWQIRTPGQLNDEYTSWKDWSVRINTYGQMPHPKDGRTMPVIRLELGETAPIDALEVNLDVLRAEGPPWDPQEAATKGTTQKVEVATAEAGPWTELYTIPHTTRNGSQAVVLPDNLRGVPLLYVRTTLDNAPHDGWHVNHYSVKIGQINESLFESR